MCRNKMKKTHTFIHRYKNRCEEEKLTIFLKRYTQNYIAGILSIVKLRSKGPALNLEWERIITLPEAGSGTEERDQILSHCTYHSGNSKELGSYETQTVDEDQIYRR